MHTDICCDVTMHDLDFALGSKFVERSIAGMSVRMWARYGAVGTKQKLFAAKPRTKGLSKRSANGGGVDKSFIRFGF